MKELHPRFRFHTGDWLTRHLVVKHCQAKSRRFTKMGDDPDIKMYEDYMTSQKREKQKKAQKHLVQPRKRLMLPGPKVSAVLRFQYAEALKYQTLNKPKQNKSAKPQGTTSNSLMQNTRHTSATNEVRLSFMPTPFHANAFHQDDDMSPQLTDVSILNT